MVAYLVQSVSVIDGKIFISVYKLFATILLVKVKSERNQSLQLRLLNSLVADAVDVVTTNEKEGTGN